MAEKKGPKRSISVLKRARQAEKRSLRNKSVISEIKTLAKHVEEASGAKDEAKAGQALKAAVKAISMAASKGIVHKKTASRKISRLTKGVNRALKQETA